MARDDPRHTDLLRWLFTAAPYRRFFNPTAPDGLNRPAHAAYYLDAHSSLQDCEPCRRMLLELNFSECLTPFQSDAPLIIDSLARFVDTAEDSDEADESKRSSDDDGSDSDSREESTRVKSLADAPILQVDMFSRLLTLPPPPPRALSLSSSFGSRAGSAAGAAAAAATGSAVIAPAAAEHFPCLLCRRWIPRECIHYECVGCNRLARKYPRLVPRVLLCNGCGSTHRNAVVRACTAWSACNHTIRLNDIEHQTSDTCRLKATRGVALPGTAHDMSGVSHGELRQIAGCKPRAIAGERIPEPTDADQEATRQMLYKIAQDKAIEEKRLAEHKRKWSAADSGAASEGASSSSKDASGATQEREKKARSLSLSTVKESESSESKGEDRGEVKRELEAQTSTSRERVSTGTATSATRSSVNWMDLSSDRDTETVVKTEEGSARQQSADSELLQALPQELAVFVSSNSSSSVSSLFTFREGTGAVSRESPISVHALTLLLQQQISVTKDTEPGGVLRVVSVDWPMQIHLQLRCVPPVNLQMPVGRQYAPPVSGFFHYHPLLMFGAARRVDQLCLVRAVVNESDTREEMSRRLQAVARELDKIAAARLWATWTKPSRPSSTSGAPHLFAPATVYSDPTSRAYIQLVGHSRPHLIAAICRWNLSRLAGTQYEGDAARVVTLADSVRLGLLPFPAATKFSIVWVTGDTKQTVLTNWNHVVQPRWMELQKLMDPEYAVAAAVQQRWEAVVSHIDSGCAVASAAGEVATVQLQLLVFDRVSLDARPTPVCLSLRLRLDLPLPRLYQLVRQGRREIARPHELQLCVDNANSMRPVRHLPHEEQADVANFTLRSLRLQDGDTIRVRVRFNPTEPWLG